MKLFVIVSTVCVLHSVVVTFADRDGVVDVGANRSSDVAVGDGDGAETAVIEDPVASQWKTIETEAKALVQKFVGMSYRDALRLVYEAELSADCIVGLTTTLKGLQELDAEVIRMMDASGKIPSGFSDGSLAELGDFDMCLRINVRNQQGETQYRGQYCSLTLDPPLPPKPPIIRNNVPVISTEGFANNSAVKELLTMAWGLYTTRLRMGFCVPDVCSPPEIARLFQIVAAKAYLNTTLLGCEREEGLTLSTSQIVAIVVLGSFVVVVLSATVLDVTLHYLQSFNIYDEKQGKKIISFLSLSIFNATAAVFHVDNSRSTLKALNGLRIFGVFWVITFHTYTYPDIGTYRALREFRKNAVYILFQFINNAWLAVDMFFFISGFLIVYNQRKVSEKAPFLKLYVKSLIQRYWRLVPLALLVLLILFLEPAMGSGPIWKEKIFREVRNCELRWWSVLGAFSNTYSFDDICMLHYWYISVDVQIYAVVLALSILSIRKPKLSIGLMLAVTVLSMIGVGIHTYAQGYHPTVFVFSQDTQFALTMNRWMYLEPHCHIGPYIVGSLTAFVYVKRGSMRIHPLVQLLLWISAFFFTGLALFTTAKWGLGDVPSVPMTLLFASTHRVAWSLGMAWILFACITKRGGVINSLLSWNALVPLGRLSYSIYLVHGYIVFFKAWTIRQRVEHMHFFVMSSALSNFMLSVIAGYLVHVFLERPLSLVWEAASKWFQEKSAPSQKYNMSSHAVPIVTVAKQVEHGTPVSQPQG